MPTPRQMEKLVVNRPQTPENNEIGPDSPPPDEWWSSVLADPRAAGKPWLPIQQRRLSEIPRKLLRIECHGVFAASRSSASMRSGFMGRMLSGRMWARPCSTAVASSEREDTKKTGAGRAGPEKRNSALTEMHQRDEFPKTRSTSVSDSSSSPNKSKSPESSSGGSIETQARSSKFWDERVAPLASITAQC